MIEVLTPIWQRVLQRPSIGIEDDFFDLGGDPSLAAKLFAEIAQACGRELPPVMIYKAPTISAQAALLERPTPPQLPAFVLMKPGAEEPPVFIAPGMGGSATEVFHLVKQIQSGHPIFGMQPRGIDGVEEPLERIEDMAELYLDAIKELQSRGPYYLIGYSVGGLVMLEIAQRLSLSGEKVALLAMLDTYPHDRCLPLRERARLVARLTKRRATTVMRSPMRDALSYINRGIERRLRFFGNQRSAGHAPTIGASSAQAVQRVQDSSYVALRRYRPRFYNGEIKFVRAEIRTDFPDNPAVAWAPLAAEFQVETVPGDHLGMVRTYAESLANVVSRYLRGAFYQQ
jgi:acetoacetyl-CoA synthetase